MAGGIVENPAGRLNPPPSMLQSSPMGISEALCFSMVDYL